MPGWSTVSTAAFPLCRKLFPSLSCKKQNVDNFKCNVTFLGASRWSFESTKCGQIGRIHGLCARWFPIKGGTVQPIASINVHFNAFEKKSKKYINQLKRIRFLDNIVVTLTTCTTLCSFFKKGITFANHLNSLATAILCGELKNKGFLNLHK